MASMTEELISILDDEKENYIELLRHSKDKRKSLIDNKIDELQVLTNKEQIIITKLNRCEKKRTDIVDSLAAVLNLKSMTVTDIQEKLPKDDAGLIDKIKLEMLSIIDDLREVNKQNELLIQEGLNYTEYTLNVMQGPTQESNSYGREIGYGSNSNSNLRYFDTRR